MLTPELDSLRERLLIAGVAPRHVRRYLRELAEHLDDARRAELERGVDRAAAERAAWQRLGSEESLVESMLAQPELRSTSARFPALVYGLGPVLAWLALAAVTLLGLVVVFRLLPESVLEQKKPAGLLAIASGIGTLYVRALPVLVSLLAFRAAAQRRSRAHWPLAGAALVALLAGTLSFEALGATSLGVNSSLLPLLVPFSDDFGPRDLSAFAVGLGRAAVMLAASLLAHRLALAAQRRLGRSDDPAPRMRWS
ncbi:MAG TPA: hypothetical protein VMG12_25035 [Polyangiaceae bacterium]|nr:hypothetical protein [Polyangiaceae bacterium]